MRSFGDSYGSRSGGWSGSDEMSYVAMSLCKFPEVGDSYPSDHPRKAEAAVVGTPTLPPTLRESSAILGTATFPHSR